MGAYEGRERAFVQYSKLEIIKESLPENTFEKFSIGLFGSEQEQFFITFFNATGMPSVKLEVCSSSWDFLYQCQDILFELSKVDKINFKPEDLYFMLLGMGIKDITNGLNKVSKEQ
jgi:hypothetical protein